MILVNNKRTEELSLYQQELREELNNILAYWMRFTIDRENGGFYGSVSNDNIPHPEAPKGIVLNSRICYTFSAAYNLHREPACLQMAERAFQYILDHFMDEVQGGVYWSVDAQGHPQEDRKQTYGIAFCIYAFAEYYKASKNEEALEKAISLFEVMEQHCYDRTKNGYIEAFTRDWQPVADLRLSEKDDNESKTMNTHLHIVEAYVNLYAVWPQEHLRQRIINLLDLFDQYFIDHNNHHLRLFFDEDWVLKSSLQSYGHDIEASWLLYQCATIVNDPAAIEKFRAWAPLIADAAGKGIDTDGGLWYEYEPGNGRLIYEKHSWPQAEAMLGFFNAYQLTQEEKYLEQSLAGWEFVKQRIRDPKNGEWFWGVQKDYTIMNKEKAGFWKCPYHSSRACMELIARIKNDKPV